jgi:DNA-binding NarL/FixJ family response regulator
MNNQSIPIMSVNQKQKYILIIEDHSSTANDMARNFQEISPDSKILQADTVNKARDYLRQYGKHIQLATIDLALPEHENTPGNSDYPHGINFIRELLKDFPEMNLMILSMAPEKAVSLKDVFLKHKGGLILESKQATPMQLRIFAQRVIEGVLDYHSIQKYLKDIGLDNECIEVLSLANRGYSNIYIANFIHTSVKTVSNRWGRIYTAFAIDGMVKIDEKDENDDKNIDLKLLALYLARQKCVI